MVKIKFETNSQAFEEFPGTECIRILEAIISQFEETYLYSNSVTGNILDINGNKIGYFEIDFSDIDLK